MRRLPAIAFTLAALGALGGCAIRPPGVHPRVVVATDGWVASGSFADDEVTPAAKRSAASDLGCDEASVTTLRVIGATQLFAACARGRARYDVVCDPPSHDRAPPPGAALVCRLVLLAKTKEGA